MSIPLRTLAGLIVAPLALAAAPASAAPGDLDPTFGGGDGIVTTDFGGNDPARAVALQSGGKIVVAGGNGDFALARYNADGSLDTGFGGGDGLVTTDFGDDHDSAKAVVVEPDGKIVAAGSAGQSFALARYNADGSPDTGFGGGDGLVTTVFPESESDSANALVVQSNGKLVAAGWTSPNPEKPTYHFALARYNADGSLDTGFSEDGRVATSFLGDEVARALLLQPNGKLVAVGYSEAIGRGSFALARYNADGSLDPGFGGGDGLVTAIDNYQAISAALQPNGKIVAAGGWEYFLTARFNSNGEVDAGFDGSGALFPGYPGTARLARAVQVQKDGRIVAAGNVANEVTSDDDFGLARYDPDGSLDTSFGGDGMVTTDVTGPFDSATALTLQPDGKVVVVGATGSPKSEFAVVRYEGGGPPPPPPPNQRTVTVSKVGSGSGLVTSFPLGIECGPTCSATFEEGGTVTVTAIPDAGSIFAGWSNAGCPGTSSCEVSVSGDVQVTAVFVRQPAGIGETGSPAPGGSPAGAQTKRGRCGKARGKKGKCRKAQCKGVKGKKARRKCARKHAGLTAADRGIVRHCRLGRHLPSTVPGDMSQTYGFVFI